MYNVILCARYSIQNDFLQYSFPVDPGRTQEDSWAEDRRPVARLQRLPAAQHTGNLYGRVDPETNHIC